MRVRFTGIRDKDSFRRALKTLRTVHDVVVIISDDNYSVLGMTFCIPTNSR